MKRKSLFSIEILAYILKYVFTLASLVVLFFAVQNFIEFSEIIFTKHSELYNYGVIKGDTKHVFFSFLYDHQYSIYGNGANKIGDTVPFKTSLVFYFLFGFISKFLLFIVCCIAVVFFHRLSERKVFDRKNSKKLVSIAVLLVTIPIIELIGDQVVLAVTTNAINSVLAAGVKKQEPGIRFLGINYAYLFTSLFSISLLFVLRHGEAEIEYQVLQSKEK